MKQTIYTKTEGRAIGASKTTNHLSFCRVVCNLFYHGEFVTQKTDTLLSYWKRDMIFSAVDVPQLEISSSYGKDNSTRQSTKWSSMSHHVKTRHNIDDVGLRNLTASIFRSWCLIVWLFLIRSFICRFDRVKGMVEKRPSIILTIQFGE